MKSEGLVIPSGSLGMTVLRQGNFKLTKEYVQQHVRPEDSKRVWKEFRKIRLASNLGIPTYYGQLFLKVFRANGDIENLGLASLRVVTDAGVAYIVDAFQNLVELENMKYHGIGTGGTAEAASQTALVSESTTALSPDNTRATGTTTEAAANIYQTVGTNLADGAIAVTEHGIFSQAATGGGTMLDRSLFTVVNLASGDSLQTDYRLTFTSGG